jgi:hypothetical protein
MAAALLGLQVETCARMMTQAQEAMKSVNRFFNVV